MVQGEAASGTRRVLKHRGHNTEAPQQGREQGVGGEHGGYRGLRGQGDWAQIGAGIANQPDTVHCGQEEFECAVKMGECNGKGPALHRGGAIICIYQQGRPGQSWDHQEGVPKGAPEQ
jgi:hypothetical protein